MVCGKWLTLVPMTSVSSAISSCFLLFFSAFPELSDRKFPHPPTPLQSIRCRSGSTEKSSSARVQRHPSTILPSVSAAKPLHRNQARPPWDRVNHKGHTMRCPKTQRPSRCAADTLRQTTIPDMADMSHLPQPTDHHRRSLL